MSKANMKLMIPELDHADLEKHGFDEHDIFQRRKFGEGLKNLIKNSDGAITIGLDSGWGNGKTTFIKMWQGHINNDMQSIYFDAFANDYQKEPFLALTAEIYELMPKENKIQFEEMAKNVLKLIIRRGLRSGISTLSSGIMEGNIVDSIEKTFTTLTNQSLENATKDKKAMIDFKRSLADWAKEQEKPVVFIIDELDRCRPNFALELIEQIKHLFSVEGITFLLVINKAQLEASIICRYGAIDASQYLQKFVHLWLRLPRKASEGDSDDVNKYMRYALEKMLDGKSRTSLLLEAEKILLEIIELAQPSFREIEQILIYFSIVTNMRAQGLNYVYQSLLAFICYLKVCNPNLLEKIIIDNINADEVFSHIKTDDFKALNRIVRYGLANPSVREEMHQKEEYQGLSRMYIRSSESLIKEVYNWLESLNLS